MPADDPCPCGTGRTHAACCGRYLAGAGDPPTAELLMRSRYTAFAVGDEAHLVRTWASGTRPPAVRLVPDQRWVGLEVLAVDRGGLLDTVGEVEFRAHHERAGRPGVLHERSAFAREDGRWVYVGPV